MQRRIMQLCLALLMIVLAGLVSCHKLPSVQFASADQSPFRFERLESRDSSPTEYGNLVAVTNNATEAQLWFEKPDKTIVAVRINFSRGVMGSQALIIPRK